MCIRDRLRGKQRWRSPVHKLEELGNLCLHGEVTADNTGNRIQIEDSVQCRLCKRFANSMWFGGQECTISRLGRMRIVGKHISCMLVLLVRRIMGTLARGQ